MRVHVALPLNITKRFVKVPGPTSREYTAIAEALPPTPRTSTLDFKDQDGKLTPACTLAKIELFYTKPMRKFFATRASARLRILDPTLRSAGTEEGETVATASPHILDKPNFLHQFFGAFREMDYTTLSKIGTCKGWSMTYCRVHDRYEELKLQSPMLLL